MKLVGAAYLVALGVQRLVTRRRDVAPRAEPRPLAAVYRRGVVVNVLNPKTALFFLAFLPQFVDPDRVRRGSRSLSSASRSSSSRSRATPCTRSPRGRPPSACAVARSRSRSAGSRARFSSRSARSRRGPSAEQAACDRPSHALAPGYDRPVSLRVAIVGSGPAGFYAADALLKSADPQVEVDMLDRLPTPWGLVRLGVAPDHENIKAVSRAFEKIAKRPGFRFFGNVDVGRDLSHADLAGIYDAVVYATGAPADRRMGIPGEELPGLGRPRSSSPGTTAIPTSRTCRSTWTSSARSWSGTGTSRSTSRGCSR